jgi:hypothetical protein
MNEPLNEENFYLYCVKKYERGFFVSQEEFDEDLRRIKYIRKLITRYLKNDDLKERLILNHIIILNNCFGPEALNKILYFKLKDYMKYVKPFLILLNILPEYIYDVGNEKLVHTDLIEIDPVIVEKLRNI